MYQCKIKPYDDVLRFIVLEEDAFVGVNKGPWVKPAWFIFDLFCSSAGVFSLSEGKADDPEDPSGLVCSSDDLHGESDGLVTELFATDGRACGFIGVDEKLFFTRFSAGPCRLVEAEDSILGPTEGRPFSLCC